MQGKSILRSKPIGRAYLFLGFAAFCWGANAVFGRLAVGEVSPMALVFLRWVGVAILVILVARKPLRENWAMLRPHLVFLSFMGALGYTGFNVLFYVAAHSTSAVNIGILQGAIPVFVLVGSFATYGNRVTAIQIVGVAVTLVGVVTIAAGGDIANLAALAFNLGDVLMIIAGMLYAGYAVGLRRSPSVAPLALFAVMAGAALVAALPLVFIEAALSQIQWPTPKGGIIITLVILFPSFLGQLCFIRGVELIGPARAGIFVNLVPIFAAILAILILGEPFKLFHGVALLLVLGGIWLSERGNRQPGAADS